MPHLVSAHFFTLFCISFNTVLHYAFFCVSIFLSVLFYPGCPDIFSLCYDYTSVYEPRRAGRLVSCPAKPIKPFWKGRPLFAETHTHTRTRAHARTLNLFTYLFICLLAYYFLCPAEPLHGKVPPAVSDTCGGNVDGGACRTSTQI